MDEESRKHEGEGEENRKERKGADTYVEHKFDITEESRLLRKFQINWEKTFAKVDTEPMDKTDIQNSLALKSHENRPVNQPKMYNFKSRTFINAKSEQKNE